ncbi:hypothetical protein CN899_07940 [Bacillus thuringiensis]|uniref:Uncharacterized protein n=1 Tax=Bacillus thuringiensis TaxID=1428 RepID=A0A9X7C1R2_BACTU|nr:hypothetical protein [Bacillus thuringiensis]PGH85762.1 hypothetical protein CN899_07940 [Bacillus thuringiensis]
MGILINKTLDNGLYLHRVYARIDSISGYKGGLDFSFNFYVSREHFMQGKGYIHQEMHHFVPDVGNRSENFIRQGYIHLKKLEGYKEAENVWEEGQN